MGAPKKEKDSKNKNNSTTGQTNEKRIRWIDFLYNKSLIKRQKQSWLEFMLVRNLLTALVFLTTVLIVLPFVVGIFLDGYGSSENVIKNVTDFSKWVLTALLAAFGAWIGAGAAYFFGKENLLASSASTQKALEIQRESVQCPAKISDLEPMPLNPDFQFKLDSPVKEIIDKLGKNVDYWFVPIIEDAKFIDTIHTEAFWRYKTKKVDVQNAKVSDVLKFIDDQAELQNKKNKLRGFFVEFKMSDLIEIASDKMKERNATVGIVCDSDGKPTHCFSISDLRAFKLGSD